MMICNENESTTSTVTNQLNTNSIVEPKSNMSADEMSTVSPTGAETAVQETKTSEQENLQTNEQEQEQQDDEFIRITAAHQILTEAQLHDDQKNYPAALHLYRICVDLLLEELMFTEGTEQSRVYLREKCTAIMDHIDYLKTKLEPIPASETVNTEQTTTSPSSTINKADNQENHESIINPPTDQLNSLHLS